MVLADRMLNNCPQPFYTADEIQSFRTFDLGVGKPTISSIVSHADLFTSLGLKLLGFKKKSEIAFEDNVKHALFIHPDELVSSSVPCTSLLV